MKSSEEEGKNLPKKTRVRKIKNEQSISQNISEMFDG
jgi:hypothetical protein